jgi:hypothetical protein
MPLREFGDHVDPAWDADGQVVGDGQAGVLYQFMDPLCGPGADGRGVFLARFAGGREVFGELPELLEVGARRKRKRVLRIGEQANVLSGALALKTEKPRRGSGVKSNLEFVIW